MNYSSLFSFEESSVWDPKLIRERLVVSPDQLVKLNLIPGWVKVQNNQDSLRLGKDFSIESSQSEYSINVTQNSQRIQNNTELFNEQIENRKKILKASKIYGKKLTRSLSLFFINENCEDLLNCKTLKRTLSLQNLCQLSDDFSLNNPEDFRAENSKKHFPSDFYNKNILFLPRSVESIKLSSQCKTSCIEPERKELFLNKEVNLETMELSNLPINICTSDENAKLQLGSAKESNGVLLTENAIGLSDQIIKHINTESVKSNSDVVLSDITDESNAVLSVENGVVVLSDQFLIKKFVNANLVSEFAKESNLILHADNIDSLSKIIKKENGAIPATIVTPCLSNVSSEPSETSDMDISYENNKYDSSSVKAVQANVISDSVNSSEINVCKNDAVSADKLKDLSLHELCSSISIAEDVPAAKLSTSEIILENEPVENNSASNISDKRSEPRECYYKNDAGISVSNNLHELCSSKSIEEDIPTSKLSTSKAVLETEHVVKNSGADMQPSDIGSEPRESYKTCDPTKSSASNEASCSKKRKLESRNKRSKRLKSEEKQCNLKIRSIKKVGEIFYSAEEVKTMLDIMKN